MLSSIWNYTIYDIHHTHSDKFVTYVINLLIPIYKFFPCQNLKIGCILKKKLCSFHDDAIEHVSFMITGITEFSKNKYA